MKYTEHLIHICVLETELASLLYGIANLFNDLNKGLEIPLTTEELEYLIKEYTDKYQKLEYIKTL